ncbi:MAG: SUMF1/EgtB/PvdO family nonheme iron enzyme [Chthoniobacterales bacterium]|nr:SUMF1/EgtB/PvdO family nonheme iron enzyme [Chthoniobacterales bacterium]
MKSHTCSYVAAALFAAFTLVPNLQAQPLVNIETVTVGDAGNAADSTTYGAVADVFAIGKYEVTISQYTTFLNSVASVTSDSYIVSLWKASMTSDLNIAGISRSGSGTLASPYSYSVIGSGNRPIAYVSWFDAARFANWVNNGASNVASTETGAYTLNGATTGTITKNAVATWFLPSEDQWYKASYYKGGGTNAGYWVYPTKSDTIAGNTIGVAGSANYFDVNYAKEENGLPSNLTDAGAYGSNSASAYDTYDQGGNVWEWNDAEIDSNRGLRGGSWGPTETFLQSSFRYSSLPILESDRVGFRVASVPEPSTYALVLMAGAGWLLWRRRKVTL